MNSNRVYKQFLINKNMIYLKYKIKIKNDNK